MKKPIRLMLPASSMPKAIKPELATLVNEPPTGDGWLHELKFDGYRIICFKQANHIKLMSRNNRDWTDHFSNVVKAISKLTNANIILDGEIVLLDENQRSNFQLLQNAVKAEGNYPFVYYIFDILYFEKYNLMNLPLLERKGILHQLIPSKEDAVLRYSSHMIGSGNIVFNSACKMGLEGIIAKNTQSTYEQGRTKNWLKVKCVKRQEFVVGGYTEPKGSRGYFGSLFLGVFNKNKELVYCGNVGTGFNQASLKEVYDQLQKYKSANNPFTTRPPGVTKALWVKPKLVVEVEFTEWTQEGILRHPSFKGVRKDKPASRIIREKSINIKKIR